MTRLPTWQLFALAVGTVTGGMGITIAHELGHRASRLDRVIAKALLVSVAYGHFFVEHVRGHHVRVATPDDPATAPRGMSVYRFIPRSVIGSLRHAWRLEHREQCIEKARLARLEAERKERERREALEQATQALQPAFAVDRHRDHRWGHALIGCGKGAADAARRLRPRRQRRHVRHADQHAAHFLGARIEQVNRLADILGRPPIIVCPYDAELFGHSHGFVRDVRHIIRNPDVCWTDLGMHEFMRTNTT